MDSMQVMELRRLGRLRDNPTPLTAAERPVPPPEPGQVLLRVAACGVCHTELDEIEGRTPPPTLPIVPGHQVVGTVVARGAGVDAPAVGTRVGVGWIFDACGACDYCRAGLENLCPDFVATGRDVDGGYAEYMVAPAAMVVPIPDTFGAAEAAPLLCAGAIGVRSLRLTGLEDGRRLGLTGFGASGHLVLQLVRHRFPRSDVFVFARNPRQRAFAELLGAVWSGDTADTAPEPLDAIIDTTPAWRPVIEALRNLAPGGRLVINAIRKEAGDRAALQDLDYARHLWLEKEMKSVANVTRDDIETCLRWAAAAGIRPTVDTFALGDANEALNAVAHSRGAAAKVLDMARV